MSTPRWIAHLSDPHLDGTPGPRRRIHAVADWLAGLRNRPDVILVTGDLTEPSPSLDAVGELARLHHTLAEVGAVVLLARGNSDTTAAFRAHLDAVGETYADLDGQLHRCRVAAGLTFLLLDSAVRGSFAGRVGDSARDWITATLAATTGPVVLALHHPPRELGHPVVDGLRADVIPDLAETLAGDGRIVATMCGHTHAASVSTWAGVPLLVAPGTHSLGQVPLASDGSLAGLIDEAAPLAVMLHRIQDGEVTTYIHAFHEPARHAG
jgi:3',5'-cyclic AMP phosphodiesterase CpdA